MSDTRTIAEIFETMTYGPAPESPAPALEWLARHGPRLRIFIDNQWREPASGDYFPSVNPATGQPLVEIAQSAPEDVEAAVQAAREAFPAWSATPGHVRARYLYALARQIQKSSRLLAVLESLDNGKPIRETRDIDIPLVARHFYHHAGWAQLMETQLPDMRPLGVVGQIIPWNFPLLMLAWKIAPALAAGNTVVLKPAEFTSVTAIAFAEIIQQIGLPAGVVNIITGDGRVGERIVKHPDIDKIAFTGSTEVGRIIRRETAGTGKRLSLELGGKSPFVVFDDADLDSVVEGVVDAIWFNQGQVCCAGSRLLVQEDIAERLYSRLRARMETLRVGDPLDKAVDIGAIVAPVQLEKIQQLVQQGVAEGARMWQPSWSCPTEGYFYPPTLFTEVEPSSTIAQVEIFGPVIAAMTFRTPAEAVALANNTPYGLAASIWSENINLALDIARKIKAGTIWINSTNLFDAASGFGGYRESGYGREGGREGLYEYLRPAWETPGSEAASSDATPQSTADHPAVNGHNNNGRGKRGRAASAELVDGVHTSVETGIPNGSDGPSGADGALPPIDRTPKLFIGGKQARPDSGYSRLVLNPHGEVVGEVGEGNRKDIRNAVEAAHAASAWASATAHNRAQILYYLAENLATRAPEFASRIARMTGASEAEAAAEVERSIERLFTYGAWADKYDGAIHGVPLRGMALAVNEPIGVLGLVCPDEFPLLGFISLVAPAIAMGNTVIAIPSERHPLSATDFYSVIETSDVPAGVVNIVTGPCDTLAKVLAEHDDVEGVWYVGAREGAATVERASAGNMKRTWTQSPHIRDWFDPRQGEGPEFLREATQVKNIWVPVGE
ncbi:MAG: aldehyde dehydrogenase family protein [Ktedonobacterales bacterium]